MQTHETKAIHQSNAIYRWLGIGFLLFLLIILTNDVVHHFHGRPWEHTLLLALGKWTNPWLTTAALGATWLGDKAGMIFLWTFSSLLWWRRGRPSTIIWLTAAPVGEFLFYSTMKALIARPRPDIIHQLVATDGFAYPSGHAGIALTFFGIFIFLELQHRREHKARRQHGPFLVILATVLTVAISSSRLYLGVHWPMDIIGGFLTGTLWLTILLFVYQSFAVHAVPPLHQKSRTE